MIKEGQSNERLKYRMYGLVPYNLSPIQQAIQFGHGVQEYNNKMFEELFKDKLKKDYKKHPLCYPFHKWANEDKTFIILNGGTTNKEPDIVTGEPKGTLNQNLLSLSINGVDVACFYEPDLGDQLTAIVFLVDERVWNKEKYPDFTPTNGLIRDITRQPFYKDWVSSIGGDKNAWLRSFLIQFRLA